jgi:hypothetical protein
MFCDFLMTLSLKNYLNVAAKLKGSSPRYGSADADPNQNVTDPQHCFKCVSYENTWALKEKEEFKRVDQCKTTSECH